MQIKNFLSTHRIPWLAIRIAVTIGSLYFIYAKFLLKKPVSFIDQLPVYFPLAVLIVSLLMLLNWFLEAYRWMLSLAPHQVISTSESMSIILAGLALNWVMPFTSGDVIARLIPAQDRFQATSAMVLNRGIMLVMTLAFGGYGAWTYSRMILSIEWVPLVILVIVLVLLAALRRKMKRFLTYFHSMSGRHAIAILVLSVLRYAVFTLQFLILLKLFLPELSVYFILGGVGWIFLVRSTIPSILGGVGVREASGIFYFSSAVEDLTLVVLPIFILWLINIVVPSLVGLVGCFRLRVFEHSSI